MNFEFSEEQEMLRDQAQKFLADNESVTRARTVLEGDGDYDRELWANWAGLARRSRKNTAALAWVTWNYA